MSTIDIHLPEALQRYLNDQIAQRGYKDASEFVRELLEADQIRQRGQVVESMLAEAANGPFSEWSEKDMEEIRATGKRLIERQRGK